ncbi:putative protein argonaute [Helianthus annuus]|nr:hypothetical protein HanIR_Chr01g0011841 [Helianthus annuus]KAJ0956078.1 putative protein argonaute [Helianthus annuus]
MISFHCQQLGWSSSYSITHFCLNNPKILILLAYVIQRSLTLTLSIGGRYQRFDPCNEAEIQAEGVSNQRIQNLALNLDKVLMVPEVNSTKLNKTFMTQLVKVHRNTDLGMKLPVYDGRRALYTAGRLPFIAKEFTFTIEDDIEWNDGHLSEVRSSIRAHDPSSSDDVLGALRKSLIW